MKIWYLVKIRHNAEQEDGMIKQVAEDYLIEAVNYTDAETIAYEYAEHNLSGEFQVAKITKTNISEVVRGCDNGWYKVKISMMIPENGKLSKLNEYKLVQAELVENALKIVENMMSGVICQFSIQAITLTSIVEVVNT